MPRLRCALGWQISLLARECYCSTYWTGDCGGGDDEAFQVLEMVSPVGAGVIDCGC